MDYRDAFETIRTAWPAVALTGNVAIALVMTLEALRRRGRAMRRGRLERPLDCPTRRF